jgi:hypothetical protein
LPFDVVSVQAAHANAANNAVTTNISFLLITSPFLRGKKESPASPLAGDLFTEVLYRLADFPFCPTKFFLRAPRGSIGLAT